MVHYEVRRKLGDIPGDEKSARRVAGKVLGVSLSAKGKYVYFGEANSGFEDLAEVVTDRMIAAYAERERLFVNLHRNALRIWMPAEVLERMAAFESRSFKRLDFSLFKPVPNDVRQELEYEASIRFGSVLADRSEERERFVTEREKGEYAARVKAWADAMAFHKSVQDYKEQQFNKLNKEKYEEKMLLMRRYLEGETADVEECLRMILAEIELPFDLSVRCKYIKTSGRLDTRIELPEDMNLPNRNAIVGADGLIKIVEKGSEEMEQLRSETIMSMVYLLAARLFAASAAISEQKVGVWTAKGEDVLFVVKFEREHISQLNMRRVQPLVDYHGRVRRDNVSIENGVISFLPLGKIKSQPMVAAEEEVKYQTQSGNWETDIRTAMALSEAMPDDRVLAIMVRGGVDAGKEKLLLPRRYERIWQKIGG